MFIQYNLEELKEFLKLLKNLKKLDFIDSEEYLHQGKSKQYYEGAQGSLLDDFGTYPL
jgi:adenylosuccinate synthase